MPVAATAFDSASGELPGSCATNVEVLRTLTSPKVGSGDQERTGRVTTVGDSEGPMGYHANRLVWLRSGAEACLRHSGKGRAVVSLPEIGITIEEHAHERSAQSCMPAEGTTLHI